MLITCFCAEQLKLKRSFVWIAFFLLPLIPAAMGFNNYMQNLELLQSGWYSLWTQDTLFYANFFFAPMIAIYCAYLWRVENFNHNRNALMTSPVPVRDLFLGKVLSAFFSAFLTQLWMGILYFFTGKLAGLYGFPPLEIWSWLFRGLAAGFAVTALQCLLSMLIRSFALPIGLAAIGSISGLLIMNTKLGYFYPYTLMIFGMNANNTENIINNGILFYISSITYSVIFILLGIIILKKADVKSW